MSGSKLPFITAGTLLLVVGFLLSLFANGPSGRTYTFKVQDKYDGQMNMGIWRECINITHRQNVGWNRYTSSVIQENIRNRLLTDVTQVDWKNGYSLIVPWVALIPAVLAIPNAVILCARGERKSGSVPPPQTEVPQCH
ncbi:uncharacterized protein LOC142340108 isoform X2 [Convolutriloba macropyga]